MRKSTTGIFYYFKKFNGMNNRISLLHIQRGSPASFSVLQSSLPLLGPEHS